ncbi:MAG: efflux RND transporter periplasmic adaptor subunit [Bacillota bacterium]
MNRKVIAAVVALALLGTGGWWFLSRRASQAAGDGVRYVQEPVRRGAVRAQVSGNGPVRSVNGVTVRANQSGTVVEILAREGDRVEAGQTIIVLENKSLAASLAQAQLDVHSARTNLENLTHPQATAVRAQELKVENARLTLEQRQEEVANLAVTAPISGVVASVGVTAGGSVNSNALLLTLYDESSPTLVVQLPQESVGHLSPGDPASVTLTGFGSLQGTVARRGGTATPLAGNRSANLPVYIDLPPVSGIRPGMVGQVAIERPGLSYRIEASGTIENDAEEVRAKVSGTVEAIHAAEGQSVTAGQLLLTIENDSLRYQLQQAENELKSQEESLARLLDPALDPGGQLITYQQRLAQAQLTLAQRQSDLEDLQVKAPVSGTLSSLAVGPGDRVSGSTDLFRVADYGSMEVTISVDELDVARIKPGQPAEITLDALPGESYRGRVTKVNPEGVFRNDIATFDVTVAVDQAEGLMAGMNASVSIVVEERQDVLHVPVAAVRILRGQASVQVLEGGVPVTRPVQIGIRTNDRYEILSGLKEGDQVITAVIRPQSGGLGGPFGGSRPGQQQGGSSFGPPPAATPSPAGGQPPLRGSRP